MISVGNIDMLDLEYAEYRCSLCERDKKHNITQYYSEGSFEEIVLNSDKTKMKKTLATGNGRERLGSTGSTGSTGLAANTSGATNKQYSMDVKIDWLITTVKEMKDEIACKNEMKIMIKQIILEELETFKQEFLNKNF